MEEMVDNLRNHLYDNDSYAVVEEMEEGVSIYLDLPSEESYFYHMKLIEEFFRIYPYSIDEFLIEGDYEGCITIESEI